MIGVILTSIGTFFEEISLSIGKIKVNNHEESPYTMGFLSLIWAAILILVIGFARKSDFAFSMASLPTFSIRALLEILQLYISVLATAQADRSTFGFIRILTIPLLLGVDVSLGYFIGLKQFIGIGFILSAFILLLLSNGINKKGILLVLFTAINAVATISLFKYNITRYNSIEAEQLLIYLILIIFFFAFARYIAKENPLKFLRKPVFFAQSLSQGIGGALDSFAFGFGSASIILAAKRASAILWSTLSGNFYFKEKRLFLKLILFSLFATGLILLAV